MKKFLSVVLALVLVVSTAVMAAAVTVETDAEDNVILPGQKFRISTDDFVDKDLRWLPGPGSSGCQ